MPSRAEIRGSIETALRVVSLVTLAWMFWLSLERGQPERVVSAGSASLRAALRDWSTTGTPPDRIAITIDSTPSGLDRDWIRALNASGSAVTWKGPVPVTALTAQAIASPRGGWNVFAAAPSKSRVTIADDVGVLDTAVAAAGGARFTLPSASGTLEALVGGAMASMNLDDSLRIKRILVIGSAGWESKFVVAALEEDGWKVDADIRIAPGASVSQGSSASIDTARYSAVIALDGTAASRASDIARYASSGGGVVLAGATGSLDAFAALRAGSPGRAIDPSILGSEPGSVDRGSLALVPIASVRNDAVSLERRDGSTVAAARRHGAGRVLQEGYLETWRWRMSGDDLSPSAHRAWWTGVVASVAYAPQARASSDATTDNAPYARLVEALGPSSDATPPGLSSAAGFVSLWLLFAILSLSLLAEWASRRLRGSR